MRRTMNAINLSISDLELAVKKELDAAKGGTVVIRNVNNVVLAEKVACLAMSYGWDVNNAKKGNYFIITLYKGFWEPEKSSENNTFVNEPA